MNWGVDECLLEFDTRSLTHSATTAGLIIIFFIYISADKEHAASPADAHGHSAAEEGEDGDGHHEIHHYEVFHVEFDRVEIPFIIALWIFVSSLAKIGEC